jgi:2-polyprenyl-3-methyl-5-hydroxy-6-metoxy-1,4-benzoquinol methylase
MQSYKTAIKRYKPSKPMQELYQRGLLAGRCLDYGCGQGYDAAHYGTAKYDPYYANTMPDGQFDTITCNYVLNVIEHNTDLIAVLEAIKSKLTDNGIAYITVRTDIKRDGPTTKGYQRDIHLNLEQIKIPGLRMYKLTKNVPIIL